jgi:hypothetical protein
MKIITTIGNYNPSGITINEGYIALLAALLTNMTPDEALRKICDFPSAVESRRQTNKGKSELILQALEDNPGLSNSEIGRRLGCSREMVRIVKKMKKAR